jgi:hypothetical protein
MHPSLFVPSGLSGLPETGSGDPASAREAFQAWEVVRRLGGALASGARMVGWHSWMSRSTATSVGFGLREDGQPEDHPAAEATQRVAWFVFQRIATLLSGAMFGRMEIPAVSTRAGLEVFLASDDAHAIVVFHYLGSFTAPAWLATTGSSPTFSHAWIALRDPSFVGPQVSTLWASWSEPTSKGTAVRFPLLFASLSPAVSGALPLRLPSYAPGTEVALSSPVEFALRLSDGPVFLLSDEEIDWWVESLATSPSG